MKKIFFSLMFLSVSNMFAMDIEPIDLTNHVRIQNFSYESDFMEVLAIIEKNREALISRDNFDEKMMLEKKTFTPENDRNNDTVIFKVAKDSKKVILGFIGYAMDDAKTGILGLIAVKERYRKENIGTQLVQSAGNDLLERGARAILAFVCKDHEVGPHLFNKLARENNLHISVHHGGCRGYNAITDDISVVELVKS